MLELQNLKEKVTGWGANGCMPSAATSDKKGGMLLRSGTTKGLYGRQDASHTDEQFQERSDPPSPSIHTITYNSDSEGSTIDTILDESHDIDSDKDSKCLSIQSILNPLPTCPSRVSYKTRSTRSSAPSPSPAPSPPPSSNLCYSPSLIPEGHSRRDWHVNSGINTDSEEESGDLILRARMESEKEARVAKRAKVNGHVASVDDIYRDRRISS